MSLRTPSTDQNRQSLLNLQTVQAQIAQNTLRISSGNQINSPGDDPTGTALILDFGNSIQANTQFLQQATSANTFLQSASDALTTVINETTSLQQIAQQGLSTTNTGSGTAALLQQVDSIRTTLLSMANTQVQGKYVFAGTQTTTLPFANSVANSDSVAYSGDAGTINLGVTATSTVATNIPGSTVFFGAGGQGSNTDLFQAVTDLSNGLSSNNTALIQSAATNLSTVLGTLNQSQATIGARQSELTGLQTTISGVNLSLQGMQSKIQGTDYAQAITDFTSEQTAQSAILSTMAKTNNNNLFNYLT